MGMSVCTDVAYQPCADSSLISHLWGAAEDWEGITWNLRGSSFSNTDIRNVYMRAENCCQVQRDKQTFHFNESFHSGQAEMVTCCLSDIVTLLLGLGLVNAQCSIELCRSVLFLLRNGVMWRMAFGFKEISCEMKELKKHAELNGKKRWKCGNMLKCIPLILPLSLSLSGVGLIIWQLFVKE